MSVREILKRSPHFVDGFRLGKQLLKCVRGYKERSAAAESLYPYVIELDQYRNIFGGYYDHTPFRTSNESQILLNANQHPAWRTPSSRVKTEVILVDWKEKRVVCNLGSTNAWNWQQGARAIWLSDREVIYNTYNPKTDAYESRIVGVDGRELERLPIPVQEYDGRGRIYSISYDALALYRPDYGYRNRVVTQQEIEQSGIDSYELGSGKLTRCLSVQDLIADASSRHVLEPTRSKINHVMASPSASRVIFLFRYYVGGRRITDIYEYSERGSKWSCVAPDCGASHVCWLNDDRLLVTMNGSSGFGYYTISLSSRGMELLWRQTDGHPTRIDDSYFMTDTYPDKSGLRYLRRVPMNRPESYKVMAAVPEPAFFRGETRCDLHPSISASLRWGQIDVAKGHRRCIAVYEL